MPTFKCGNCKESAKVYCVACKKPFCKFCVALLHHPSTKQEKHSIEEIANFQGVKILTPILLDLLLLGGVVFLLSGSGITQDYFKGASYCPGLTRGRSMLMKYDPNMFFYFKAHMATYCDLEDSYWRFFMDTWIRGILTETDTWLLIGSELLRAFLLEEFIRIVVSPMIAWSYSLVATVVRAIELKLYRFVSQEEESSHSLTRFLLQMEKAVDSLSLAHKLELDSSLKVTPQTIPRKRPMQDWLEHWAYLLERRTRQSVHYRAQAHTLCTFVLRGTLVAAVVVRVWCMLFGGAPFVLLASIVGAGDLIEQHTLWFTEYTGMAPHTKGGHLTDWVASLVLSQAVGKMNIFGGAAKGLGGGLVGSSRAALAPMLIRLALFLAVVFAGPALFWMKIRRQRADFDAKWKKEYAPACWPGMSRKKPCQDWEGNWYSCVPEEEKTG